MFYWSRKFISWIVVFTVGIIYPTVPRVGCEHSSQGTVNNLKLGLRVSRVDHCSLKEFLEQVSGSDVGHLHLDRLTAVGGGPREIRWDTSKKAFQH